MKWNIVADTSIDLFELERSFENIEFSTVPFSLTVGDKVFVDDENLDKEQLIREMAACKEASTSACPSTGAWLEEFEKDGYSVAITITSGLSGSYNSACAAKELMLEKNPDKKVYVIDSLTTGAESVLILRKLCQLIESGLDFEAAIEAVENFRKNSYTVFALCSFANLVKNGRMSKLKGFVANALGFWGIGIASTIGTIEIKGIARGHKKAIELIISDMRERAGQVQELILDHCMNEQFSAQVEEAVKAQWPDVKVSVIPTRGLCSYYAEKGGLIIGYC